MSYCPLPSPPSLNWVASVDCPAGAYKCHETVTTKYQKCLYIDNVCDGTVDCALGDDEQRCGKVYNLVHEQLIYEVSQGIIFKMTTKYLML